VPTPLYVTPDHSPLVPRFSEARWYAAYVVTRHEKVVAEQLVRRSVESFLPLYQTVRHWKGRRAQVNLPLFPSYVFVRIPASDRLRVLVVPGVVQIVTFNGVLAALPDDDVERLRAALQLRQCEPCAYLSTGKRVRIAWGPLHGLEGVIVRQRNQTRIVVSLDFIHRSTSVEFRPEDLECISEIHSSVS
jgi:transcription antitermination factor NusG